jgi:hypothetical protein
VRADDACAAGQRVAKRSAMSYRLRLKQLIIPQRKFDYEVTACRERPFFYWRKWYIVPPTDMRASVSHSEHARRRFTEKDESAGINP